MSHIVYIKLIDRDGDWVGLLVQTSLSEKELQEKVDRITEVFGDDWVKVEEELEKDKSIAIIKPEKDYTIYLYKRMVKNNGK